MDGRPGPDEVRRRSSVLRQLGQRRRAAFARAQVGETVDVVMERRRVGARSWLTGLTDHYLRVYLDGDDAWMGKRLTCRVREVVPAGLLVSVEGGQA
jgi:tRNA A37 methylthiotransferase MiaB